LIEKALSWVSSEYDKLCVHITNELEKVARETLLSQPDVTYRAPGSDEIDRPR
jgi:hypothetical protein